MTTQVGFAPIEGGQLYYEVTGQGSPLLLIHAGVANLRMWDAQVAYFADRYHVICYDSRGFGKTTTENVSYSNRQDIIDLLKHLGITQQVHLMGLSRGGHIALDFTVEYPKLVDALIVVAGGVGGYAAQEPNAEEMTLFDRMEVLEEKQDWAALAAMETHVWVDGPLQAEGRAAANVRQVVHDLILANYAQHSHETPQPRVLNPVAAEQLGTVHVPVLVIKGTFDTTSTNLAMDYLASQIAHVQVESFDTAHMVNLEQPERFNQIVSEFLAHVS